MPLVFSPFATSHYPSDNEMQRSGHVVITVIPRLSSDVQLCAVHILGLGIIHFYSHSQQNEPTWKSATGSCKTHTYNITFLYYC